MPGLNLESLQWYARRLAAMSPPELIHRVKEQALRRSAGRKNFGWAAFELGDGDLPKFPLMNDIDLNSTFDAICSAEPGLIGSANDVIDIGPHLLGRQFPQFIDGRDWNHDPVTGGSWPSGRYCFDIPFRQTHALGDIKYLLELNRLQYLVPLAVIGHFRDAPNLIDHCLRELEHWIDENPPFQGIAWVSGIELALRMINITLIVTFAGADAISSRLRIKIRSTLAAHMFWLARYPSRFSSANNHLIAEQAGLFLISSLWTDCPDRQSHMEHSHRALIEEAGKQIHPDGVGAEQSPTYTAFTAEFLLLSAMVGRHTSQPFPEPFSARLKAVATHFASITDLGGHVPRIGDDDEGRVILAGLNHEETYVTSIASCIASELDSPEIAPPKCDLSLRHLFFKRPQPGPAPSDGITVFKDGGLTALRRTVGTQNILAVLDHGPLGYLSIAAHGHADALSLWLHIDDQPVFVDAGTFLYHGGGAARDRFRGTAMHNTLCLEDEDQSEITGPFNWGRKATANIENWTDQSDLLEVTASHDGYLANHNVRHIRQLQFSGGELVITDTLDGSFSEPLQARIAFLLHPDLDVVSGDQSDTLNILRNDVRLATLISDPKTELTLYNGHEQELLGWCSPRFGTRSPTTQIVFSATPSKPTSWQFRIHFV